jgi:hypothetical protein
MDGDAIGEMFFELVMVGWLVGLAALALATRTTGFHAWLRARLGRPRPRVARKRMRRRGMAAARHRSATQHSSRWTVSVTAAPVGETLAGAFGLVGTVETCSARHQAVTSHHRRRHRAPPGPGCNAPHAGTSVS